MPSLDLDDSENDGGTTTTGNTPPRHRPSLAAEIAAKENTQVRYSRLLVIFVLTCSALGVGYFTFSFVTNEEEDDFKTQVRGDNQHVFRSNSYGTD